MDTGELISFYRKQAGLTIDELALISGVPKGTLNKIIGGVTKAPTLDNMKAIAYALGKRLADFDDEKETAPSLSDGAEKLTKDIERRYGKTTSEAVAMYVRLDGEDQGEIRGEMKQMLKAEKYCKKESSAG